MNQVIALCDNYLAFSLTPCSGPLRIKQVSAQRHCPGLNFRVISNLCNNNNNQIRSNRNYGLLVKAGLEKSPSNFLTSLVQRARVNK